MKKILVVMDPLKSIYAPTESTIALLEEATQRKYKFFTAEITDLFVENGIPFAKTTEITLTKNLKKWYRIQKRVILPLTDFKVILMRKDPPVDIAYLSALNILSLAQKAGVFVTNNPISLQALNEKLFALEFKKYCPPQVITSQLSRLATFLKKHRDVIIKPLNNRAGLSVYRLQKNNRRTQDILRRLTENETTTIIMQRYLKERDAGDKRLMFIDGKCLKIALARFTPQKQFCWDERLGGTLKPYKLNQNDKAIAKTIGPVLKKRGLLFVGIDIIGKYLIEINFTSPGLIRQFDAHFKTNLSAKIWDAIEKHLNRPAKTQR